MLQRGLRLGSKGINQNCVEEVAAAARNRVYTLN